MKYTTKYLKEVIRHPVKYIKFIYGKYFTTRGYRDLRMIEFLIGLVYGEGGDGDAVLVCKEYREIADMFQKNYRDWPYVIQTDNRITFQSNELAQESISFSNTCSENDMFVLQINI